jgi:hypothetical protein
MPSPCRSLLLNIDGDTPSVDELLLGVQITTPSNEALIPGSANVLVDLHLLSDRPDLYLVSGATFTLRTPFGS